MPSQHLQARKLIRRGIFDDIRSFCDLEERIGQLSNTKEVGDAFEVFVEGYLATQKIMQAEKVWIVGQIPLEIRRKLNLPANTKGVDGIFRTLPGELVPYQVKFRSACEPLTYTEVASFLGLTERARDRVIFTNASDVARDAKTRDAIRTVRAQDFNRLTQDDFVVIESWLKHQPVQPPKRMPRPYQGQAIDRILNTFRNADRATAVMACGIGKTLVALWVAEAMHARRMIVFVPSLALLSQTLKEWSRWTSWDRNYQYLCVCSDPTVSKGIDELRLDQIDTDFPIGTDPVQVRRFLRSTGKRIQVIFSTYQSAPVIMKGARGLGPFDLALLDEAHKTAGVQGSAFALPLLDGKIQVKKRLFLTATPRHYDISHRDREGDFRVISMDNQALYGPVAYRLTFAEAAKKGIICNYKVVVSIVDGKEVTEFALAHGITLVDKNEIAVRWVAHQLALQKAIKKVRATRVITFHTTVRLAQRFASLDVEGIARHLNGFSVYHVNGEQPSAEREDRLNAFRDAKWGVITNARCLTEGVDVPAVDMIAFMNPRRSRVDIAQATGRAMRKAGPEKIYGYVVVPLFLNQHRGESVEKALERSDFEDVANVLNAMQEQDADLVEIIRELREARGRLGRFRISRLSEKLQIIGPRISLDRLRSNIFVRVVDRLGLSWDENYGKLAAYKKQHGHCNVPQKWQPDRSLATWVSTQRSRKAQLSPERILRLEALGFDWDPHSTYWEQMYGRLAAYKKQHGHCNASRWEHDKSLGMWVSAQREVKAKGQLSLERIHRLDALGFSWDPDNAQWEEMYARLIGYKKQHKDCKVPARWKPDLALGAWVSHQRALREKDSLLPERIRRLEALGFEWAPHSSSWEQMYRQLVAYKEQHGHCNVPFKGKKSTLTSWIHNQRTLKSKNQLSPERVRRLDALGFTWNPKNAQWEEMYRRLISYKKSHGDCNVLRARGKDQRFVEWIDNQRRRKSKNHLPQERIRLLDALGFVWAPKNAQWEEMYRRLVAYKKSHGDCNVPKEWIKDRALGQWVSKQRHNRVLTPDRLRRMNAVGFDWNPLVSSWEEKYKKLLTFKKRYGHCNVPRIGKNQFLASWSTTQRVLKSKNRLSPERVHRLDALGFTWDPKNAQWEETYRRLIAYKKSHGDCNVPSTWIQDRSLGNWVVHQRILKAKGKLSPERICHLDAFGFAWNRLRRSAAIKDNPHDNKRSI